MILQYTFRTSCTGYNSKYEEFYYEEKEFEYEIDNGELRIALVDIITDKYALKGFVGKFINDLDLDNDYLLDLVDKEEIKEYFYEEAFDKWKENQEGYDTPTTY